MNKLPVLCLLACAAFCGLSQARSQTPSALPAESVADAGGGTANTPHGGTPRPPLVISRGPIACTPGAVTAEEFDRLGRILQRIVAQVEEIQETKSGGRFRLPSTPENAEALGQWIALERACCPFLTFAIDFEPDDGPIWLEIAGPDGTKAFLDQVIASSDLKTIPAAE